MMMGLTSGLFTQVSDSGPHGPLIMENKGESIKILSSTVSNRQTWNSAFANF